MRAFFSSAIVAGTVFLCISSLHAQVPGSDPDYTPPQIVTTPRLTPPKEAVDSGLGGTVRVSVSIDQAGNVTSAEDARGPGTVCQQVTRPDVVAMRNAAREAALLAKFTPATRRGKPIESSTWLNFKFPGAEQKTEFVAAPATPNPRQPDDGNRYTIMGTAVLSPSPVPPAGDQTPIVNVGGDLPSKGGNVPKRINGGVLNGKATSLPKPRYPPAARAVRADGPVSIQVLIDENGEVFTAEGVSGHPLLRAAAAQAACGSKFSPIQLAGHPVKVSGIIVYNFVP